MYILCILSFEYLIIGRKFRVHDCARSLYIKVLTIAPFNCRCTLLYTRYRYSYSIPSDPYTSRTLCALYWSTLGYHFVFVWTHLDKEHTLRFTIAPFICYVAYYICCILFVSIHFRIISMQTFCILYINASANALNDSWNGQSAYTRTYKVAVFFEMRVCLWMLMYPDIQS